jgi:Putative rhamnosyl transferase
LSDAPKYQHLILTRYTMKGLFYEDFSRDWLDERLQIFRQYCVPGIADQTREDFSWLVFCDESTDSDYVEAVEESTSLVPQLRVVLSSHERGIQLRKAMMPLVEDDTEVLITTRLDTDDTLHEEAIAVLQSYLAAFVGSPHERFVVNFPRGYRFEDPTGRLYACYWPHGPFMTLFQKIRPASRKFYNLYWERHNWLHHIMPLHFDESIPGWLQVIHGLAESTEPGRRGQVVKAGNRESVVKEDIDIEVDPGEAGTAFGVDLSRAS